MIDCNSWNAFVRDDPRSPWRWVAAGPFYSSANGAAALKAPDLERVVLFGRTLPGHDGQPLPVRRRF